MTINDQTQLLIMHEVVVTDICTRFQGHCRLMHKYHRLVCEVFKIKSIVFRTNYKYELIIGFTTHENKHNIKYYGAKVTFRKNV